MDTYRLEIENKEMMKIELASEFDHNNFYFTMIIK